MIQLKHIFGNRTFANKEELHDAIVAFENQIFAAKKSMVFKSIEKGQGVSAIDLGEVLDETQKSALNMKADNAYFVINSTLWLDSHLDVHNSNCYNKTVQDQKGKVYLVDAHGDKSADVVSYPDSVKMLVKDIDWKTLGKNIAGTTTCLVLEIPKKDVRPDILELVKRAPKVECSLRMRYVKMRTALNSDRPEYSQYKQNYDEMIDLIANKKDAEKYGYFTIVDELAIVGEGSVCPITGGSNSATVSLLPEDNSKAADSTFEPQQPQPNSEEFTEAKQVLEKLLTKFD